MSKLSLLKFAVRPGEIAAGVRKLGGRGALVHGVRRLSATVGRAMLGPAQLRINPMGAVCNHACGMCWLQHLPPGVKEQEFAKDRATALDLDEYRALFDGMPPGLAEVNVVGGGEPLVHPQCVDIMREIKRRRIRGYLMSNGTLLRAPVAEAMVAMGWDLTRLSVHAGDAETFRVIHGVDHFDRLSENLRNFDRLRRAAGRHRATQMHIHNVVQRENIETIPAMFAWAEQIGADHLVFEIVFALSPHIRLTRDECARAADVLASAAAASRLSSNAAEVVAGLRRDQLDAPRQRLAPPEPAPPPPPPPSGGEPAARPAGRSAGHEPRPAPRTNGAPAGVKTGVAAEVKAGVAASAADPSQATAPLEPPYRPANRCSVGFDSSMVTAQGQVVPCCFSTEVMGNVREQSFREIWFGAAYTDFRRRLITGQFPEYCSRVRCKLKAFLHD